MGPPAAYDTAARGPRGNVCGGTHAEPGPGRARQRRPRGGGGGRAARRRGTAADRAPVAVGHLDHQQPSLPYVLADRPGAVVVPLLLGDGYQRTVDIPAVARRFDCAVTRGLGGELAVAVALYDRLRAAERRPAARPTRSSSPGRAPPGPAATTARSRRSGSWRRSCRCR
ncbi:hypothetical protein ACI2LO_16655 [Streptomyces sp. NPDC033754]|uniref:hypothetical protein n=1 Tax=unclassified Streptomyces TaxID=2593676 RepID=UPI0033D55527